MPGETVTLKRRQTNARLVLLGLFGLFFLPVAGAVLVAAYAPHWTPFGSINLGELVRPPVAEALHDMTPLDVKPMSEVGSSAPWIIAHVGDFPCDGLCDDALVQMRQARLALGKDAHRVERWWLLRNRPDAGAVSTMMQKYPGLRIGLLGERSPLAEPAMADTAVQIVDPAGFLILRYPLGRSGSVRSNDVARDVLKDLKRLLKNSKQGSR